MSVNLNEYELLAWPSVVGRYNFILASTRSLNALQAMKAKAVQARKLLGISELCHTHRTGYLFVKIVQQGLDIHD